MFKKMKLFFLQYNRVITIALFLFVVFFMWSNQASANSSEFSLSIWVNVSSVASKAIVAKAEEIRLATNATGQPLCQIMSGSSWQTAVSASKAISANTWAHLACTYNENKLKIFIDGKEMGSNDLSVSLDDTSADMKIGTDDSSGSSYGNLAGVVDDFWFHNYALNIDEVKTMYNSGASAIMGEDTTRNNNGAIVTGANKDYCIPGDTATCSPPVLELKMDEKSGTTTYDTSGKGNDGVFVNSASSPTWTRGKYGSGLEFDKSDDYINIGNPLHSSMLQLTL